MSARAKSGSRRRQEANSAKAPAVRLVTSAATAAQPHRSNPAAQEATPPYAVAAVCDRPGDGDRRSQSAATGAGEGSDLRFIDLFCGIGGFRLAFERAGGQCVFSSDWDRFSQQTYAANFGEKPQADRCLERNDVSGNTESSASRKASPAYAAKFSATARCGNSAWSRPDRSSLRLSSKAISPRSNAASCRRDRLRPLRTLRR